MIAMSPKQRALTVFARKEADRVPLNYLCNEGIDARLKAHFGLAKEDGEGLRRALNVDFRTVGAKYIGPKLHADVGDVKTDNWGIHRRWIEHETGGYWDYCDWPLRDATIEEIEAWPLPDPDHFDYVAIESQCRRHADYCIMTGGAGTGDIINSTSMLRTMEQVLLDLITDDPACLRLIDRVSDIEFRIRRRELEAGNGRIDVLWIGEDLGTQRGPTISLELFRRHIRPRLQKFVDLAREFNIPTMIHSCGSSSWAFDDFIEMGIGIVDTLQPEAVNMSPAYLKKRYGDRLAFHGMISTAGPLAYGTVDDVIKDVRHTLKIMAGGGYACAPTHSIQDNSPTENVVAFYEEAKKSGCRV